MSIRRACAVFLVDTFSRYAPVLDFSRSGKLTDYTAIETNNGRFRAECLNQHWVLTLADAAKKLEAWRRSYIEERPHDAIGNTVPIVLTKSGGVTGPSP